MIGRVISVKMNNTVTVLVSRVAKHPLYKKTFIRSKKYLVATEGDVKEGDMVEIIKIRPISKNKHWKVARVIGKNLAEINEEKLKMEAEKIIAEALPVGRQVMPEEKEKKIEKVEEKEEVKVKVKKEKK